MAVSRDLASGQTVLQVARRYVSAGLSVVAVPPNGSKRPRGSWRRYQWRLPTERELRARFGAGGDGLAVLCGRISRGLEVLDFDDADLFDPWCAAVEAHAPGLLSGLPVVRSPGPGFHVYLRSAAPAGNQKLAEATGPHGRPVTLIETRGEGGLVLTPACPPACHPSGRPYTLLQGELTDVPVLSPGQRSLLLDAARSFNRYVACRRLVTGLPARRLPGGAAQSSGRRRPGDVYEAETAWPAILEPHGWECVRVDGDGVGHWRRPGKRDRGWSATTDYASRGLLYVFSSNAAPFEPGRAYTKFAARALLAFRGDFRAAARDLVARERGWPAVPTFQPGPARPPVWPGEVVLRPDGTTIRRLPPLTRPVGAPPPALIRPRGDVSAGALLAATGAPVGAGDGARR